MNAFDLEMNQFPIEQRKPITWLKAYRILFFLITPICWGIIDIVYILSVFSLLHLFDLAVRIFYFSCFFVTKDADASAYRSFIASIFVLPAFSVVTTIFSAAMIYANYFYTPSLTTTLSEILGTFLWAVIWITLNIIYFHKRKFLFYEVPSVTFSKSNVAPAYETVKCSNSHAQLIPPDKTPDHVQNTVSYTAEVMRAKPAIPQPISQHTPPVQIVPPPIPVITPKEPVQNQMVSDDQLFFKIKCVVKEIQGKAVFPDLQQIESFLFVYAVILQRNDDTFLADLFEEFKDTTVYKPDILKNFITQCAISYNESAAQGIDTLIDQYAKDISSVFPQIKTRNFKKYLTFLAKRIQTQL